MMPLDRRSEGSGAAPARRSPSRRSTRSADWPGDSTRRSWTTMAWGSPSSDTSADYSRTHNIAVDLALDEPDMRDLPPAVQLAVFEIIQEALTNVAKHSAATPISIRVARSATGLETTVADNGRGFDADAARPTRRPSWAAKHARTSGHTGRHRCVSVGCQGHDDFRAHAARTTRSGARSKAPRLSTCLECTKSQS